MTGAERIAAERARQLVREHDTEDGGTSTYDATHDDQHDDESLAMAAACYAAPERIFVRRSYAKEEHFADPWPWGSDEDRRRHNGNMLALEKTTKAERVRLLEKAGALIAAEIDRLLRTRDDEPDDEPEEKPE